MQDVGSAQAPALVLLHGGLVSHREWDPQLEHFGRRWRVVTPDLQGHGSSTHGDDEFSLERWSDDVELVRAALELGDIVVVGHSLGGMVAQHYAREHSDHVTRMVLVDTTYSTSSTRKEARQTRLAKLTFRATSVERMARISGRDMGKREPSAGAYVEREMPAFADDKARYLAIWDAIFAFDSRPWLPSIDVPALVLVAGDNRATLAQGARITELLPNARLEVLPDTGHMLHWERPGAFNAIVDDFVSTHE